MRARRGRQIAALGVAGVALYLARKKSSGLLPACEAASCESCRGCPWPGGTCGPSKMPNVSESVSGWKSMPSSLARACAWRSGEACVRQRCETDGIAHAATHIRWPSAAHTCRGCG
jgi:hypothetical protein